MTADNMISRDEARILVGKMLFGADWISVLTDKQSKLLNAKFGRKRRPVFRGDVMIKWIDVFEKPCPDGCRQEFDIAIGRYEPMRIQGLTVDDWIAVVAELDLTHDVLDRQALEAAMKRHQQQERPANADKKSRGPQPIERNRVVNAMRADIEDGKVTLAQLDDFGRDANALTYSTSPSTAGDAFKQLALEFQSAATPTNSNVA